jgi:hypothetical protein
VPSVWGNPPRLPSAILDPGIAHASELGRTVASDDLFLLALTELGEAVPTRRALAPRASTATACWLRSAPAATAHPTAPMV